MNLKYLMRNVPKMNKKLYNVLFWKNVCEELYLICVILFQAVKLIRPVSNVTSHPVSTTVNRWQEKGEECIKPIDLEWVYYGPLWGQEKMAAILQMTFLNTFS